MAVDLLGFAGGCGGLVYGDAAAGFTVDTPLTVAVIPRHGGGLFAVWRWICVYGFRQKSAGIRRLADRAGAYPGGTIWRGYVCGGTSRRR